MTHKASVPATAKTAAWRMQIQRQIPFTICVMQFAIAGRRDEYTRQPPPQTACSRPTRRPSTNRTSAAQVAGPKARSRLPTGRGNRASAGRSLVRRRRQTTVAATTPASAIQSSRSMGMGASTSVAATPAAVTSPIPTAPNWAARWANGGCPFGLQIRPVRGARGPQATRRWNRSPGRARLPRPGPRCRPGATSGHLAPLVE